MNGTFRAKTIAVIHRLFLRLFISFYDKLIQSETNLCFTSTQRTIYYQGHLCFNASPRLFVAATISLSQDDPQ